MSLVSPPPLPGVRGSWNLVQGLLVLQGLRLSRRATRRRPTPARPPRGPPSPPGLSVWRRGVLGVRVWTVCGLAPALARGPRSCASFLSLEPPSGGGRLIQPSLRDPAPSAPAGIRGPGFCHPLALPAKFSVILRAQDPECCAVVPVPPAPIPL